MEQNGVMLCGFEVKSEQPSLESFAEDGEWFCCANIGQEFVSPLGCQNREESQLRWVSLVCSQCWWYQLANWCCWAKCFGGKQVQFHWQPWTPAPPSWIWWFNRRPVEVTEEGDQIGEFGLIENKAHCSILDMLQQFRQRLGVQPRVNCSSTGKRWPMLGPGVVFLPLWGKTGSCGCKIGPR